MSALSPCAMSQTRIEKAKGRHRCRRQETRRLPEVARTKRRGRDHAPRWTIGTRVSVDSLNTETCYVEKPMTRYWAKHSRCDASEDGASSAAGLSI
jgi:hypothetical protein